eukprot:NODE_74_length_24438_cov_0.900283.p3 type:complete len:446 gc:universal NODE_74_length_24438_cov_0.900283:13664-15001(+)
MKLEFAFVGRDLENKLFLYGDPVELKIGGSIASHQFFHKLDGSKYIHIYNETSHICVTEYQGYYYIISMLFEKIEPQTGLLDFLYKKSETIEYFDDMLLESDIESSLAAFIQIYSQTKIANLFLLNDSICELFTDSDLKLNSIVHSRLEKLRCDIYWTPRFKKNKGKNIPLMFLDQGVTHNCNISRYLAKYLILNMKFCNIDQLPKGLSAFPRPAQCRSNFLSKADIDNHYYVFKSDCEPDKMTCIWVPIPFIVIVFAIATRENLSEIMQEIESDINLTQRLCNTHNSILKSLMPKKNTEKKKVQYSFYPNTSSFLQGKFYPYFIDPDSFGLSACKINLNIAHIVSSLVRRYLLEFQLSSHAVVIAKPFSDRLKLNSKVGSSAINLMNFWILSSDKKVSITYGTPASVIRSCPVGVNLDQLPCSQADISLSDANTFLSAFEKSFL